MPLRIGVVSIQGDFAKHIQAVELAGGRPLAVRDPSDLQGLNGIILPGGESTTISLLSRYSGLWDTLSLALKKGLPAFGTCAGLILLSEEVEESSNNAQVCPLGLLRVKVQRNAYGRQRESFVGRVKLNFDGYQDEVPGVFIRAPRIVEVGLGVTVLAHHGNDVVLVQQGQLLGATFHPELGEEVTLHKYFLDIVSEAGGDKAGSLEIKGSSGKEG